MSGRIVSTNRVAASGRITFNAPFSSSIPNMELWYRSDLGVTVTAGIVSAWADQSGNGRTATPGGGGGFFYVTQGGPNNLPYLLSVGAQSPVNLQASLTLSQPCEVFSVTDVNPLNSLTFLFDCGNSVNYVRCTAGRPRPNNQFNGSLVSGFCIVSAQFNGASSVVTSQGNSVSGNAGGGTGNGTFTIGNAGTLNVTVPNRYYELFAFSRILTASERAQVVAYLTARYSARTTASGRVT